jgi:phosphoribosylformimino-5-aminoimidazole carboxamide ribotide isomerase
VQIGGGIRNEKKVKAFLDLGVARVILGTVAVRDRALLERLLADYGSDKIIVSIDAKDGKVATEGWAQVSALDALNLCQQLEKSGVKTIVYTDIAKDGMLHGPNFQIYEELMEKTELALIASGGITSLEDVRRLQSMQVYGAIIGKAFYDQKLNFKEVLACLQ